MEEAAAAPGDEIMSSEIQELGNHIEKNRVREDYGSVCRLSQSTHVWNMVSTEMLVL